MEVDARIRYGDYENGEDVPSNTLTHKFG